MVDYFRLISTAVPLLLCLSGRPFAHGRESQLAEESPAVSVAVHLHGSVAAVSDVTKNSVAANVTGQGTVFDRAVRRPWRAVPDEPDDSRLPTNDESSLICTNALLCSENFHQSDRCSCHSYCYLFDDCCADALQTPLNRSVNNGLLPRTGYSCYLGSAPAHKAVNIITSCPAYYEIEAIAEACNQSQLSWNFNASLGKAKRP